MLSSKKTARVIILPALGKLSDLDLNLRNWLSRSNASYTSTHKHILNHLLSFFGEQEKVTNFGALRYFGETSKKPKQYIAAADPVIIQTHGNQLSIKTVRHSVEIVKEISKDLSFLNFTDIDFLVGISLLPLFNNLFIISSAVISSPIAITELVASKFVGFVFIVSRSRSNNTFDRRVFTRGGEPQKKRSE